MGTQSRQPWDLEPRNAAPPYRHAAPSGPWPWMDIDSDPEPPPAEPPLPLRDPTECSHTPEECGRCWTGYPESRFPNWKPAQVRRCAMKEKVAGSQRCVIYCIDVKDDATFVESSEHVVFPGNEDDYWQEMQQPHPKDLRVRALFLENLSRPVLEMLGTKYNIEPFFFSSSLNWIPSRFQEDARRGKGDHITITLTFLRPTSGSPQAFGTESVSETETKVSLVDQQIDTQAPLLLRSVGPYHKPSYLVFDLLAIHMVRTPDSSTIISYHPPHDTQDPTQPESSAKRLHTRVDLAGQSVYWQNIFQRAEDPTFVFLAILWHALYAWDEALELLWEHIGQLELKAIKSNDMGFTHELHKVRAYVLHYSSLLEDFKKTVEFIHDTPNPAMASSKYNEEMREVSQKVLRQECQNLLTEVERLSKAREMQDMRLENVMKLVFSIVNIEDSRRMQSLTQATVRDSEAMKQIAYLSMFFLPASFCTGVFGMNIREINPGTFGTLSKYFATAIPLTAITVWIVIALQAKWQVSERDGYNVLKRLLWPLMVLASLPGFIKPAQKRHAVLRRMPTETEMVQIRSGARTPDTISKPESDKDDEVV